MNNEQVVENNGSKPPKAKESASITELTRQMSEEEVAQAVKELAQNRLIFSRNWQRGHQLKNGKYIIEKELGSGGFGITYLATDNQGEQVAIKILKDELLRRNDFNQLEEDFVNEAMKLSQPNHPNIVPIIEVIYESGWCIVMKYIEGKTLEALVQERGSYLSPKKALHYINQIGEALKAVHARGLLHKDVKPKNIIIQEEQSVAVLIDFGLALKFDSNPVRNIGGLSHGYAPIEQYEPIVTWGYYTDVYGLAATLYFMLTKNKPIPAKSRLCAAHKLVPAKHYNKAISDHLNDAISQGMSLEAKSRPKTVEEWLSLINNTPGKTPSLGWTILLLLFPIGLLALTFGVPVIIDIINRPSYPPRLSLNGETITNELTNNKTCNILTKKYCYQYNFTGRRGDKVNIEMSSNEIDPHLILVEPSGTELAEIDDISVNDSNATIEAELPVNGDYIVIAQSSQEQEVGKYTLRARKISP